MITALTLQNWKSYVDAIMYIDRLSVLIGTNASGKSNVLDAFFFLNRISSGLTLSAALQGDASTKAIRGGMEWAAKKGSSEFMLGIVFKFDELTDFEYKISCTVSNGKCEILSEELLRKKFRPKKEKMRGASAGEIKLFRTDPCSSEAPNIVARLYNEKQGSPRQLSRSNSVLYQLSAQKNRQEIQEGIDVVIESLKNIFILDPIPSHMRIFSPLSEKLEIDASNIAGIIAAFTETQKREFDSAIAQFVVKLPEREISRIYAERVGKFLTDAMLYCDENWSASSSELSVVDARGMSDGTLRFLAILTSLISRPEHSLLIIEEVDNGLHPSRANLLLDMLMKLGHQRNVDVLVTTHNPALLDAMGNKMIPFITVANRSLETGVSNLTLLEDLRLLPKMIAIGPLGRLSSIGAIERAIRHNDQTSFDFAQ
jgi:AAA15 family ATPase/GTPase